MPYRDPETNRVVYRLGERGSGFKPRSLPTFHDIQKIKAYCKKHGNEFEDEEFPATVASIGTPKAEEYVWKTPWDIVPKGTMPEFIANNQPDRFAVKQGQLGNCWFLAAVADLTLDRKLFDFVVPQDNSFNKLYCHAFHFRFWQFGRWIDVVIDDRLPCRIVNGKPHLAFMYGEKRTEFWSALLEKAYAKLVGSYAGLNGGCTFEGLQDFTGGCTELFMIKDIKDDEAVFNYMRMAQRQSDFMASNVKSNQQCKEEQLPNGLVKGHAYSVTDIRLLPVKEELGEGLSVQLLRLRNPWGNKVEWNGDFSDGSPKWREYFNEQTISKLGHTYQADGEFWMCLEDFISNFERVEVCHLVPEMVIPGKTVTKHWIAHGFYGKWLKDVTSGGPLSHGKKINPNFEDNPQYLLSIQNNKVDETSEEEEDGTTTSTVIVAIIKNDRKSEHDCEVKNFTFEIFDASGLTNLPKPLSSEFFEANWPMDKKSKQFGGLREISVRLHLEPGDYIIVPCTYKDDEEGDFLIRVFTNFESSLSEYDRSVERKDEDLVDVKEATPEEIEQRKQDEAFFLSVADGKNQVDWYELKMLLDKTFYKEFRYEGFGFSEDSCRSMLALLDADRSGKLEYFEFMKLWLIIQKWKKIFDKFATSHDEYCSISTSKLATVLQAGGYQVNKEVLSSMVLRYGDRKGELWFGRFIVAAVKLEIYFEQFTKYDEDGTGQAKISLQDWLRDSIYS